MAVLDDIPDADADADVVVAVGWAVVEWVAVVVGLALVEWLAAVGPEQAVNVAIAASTANMPRNAHTGHVYHQRRPQFQPLLLDCGQAPRIIRPSGVRC